MSGVAGVLDPGVSNATAWRRSSAGLYVETDPARSRIAAPLRLPDITASVTATLGLSALLARGALYPTYTDPATATTQPVTIVEQQGSRSLSQTEDAISLTRIYLIHGSKDPAAVRDVGPQPGDADTTYTGLICTDRRSEPYGKADSASGGYGVVQLTCTFAAQGNKTEGGPEPTFSYDYGSETEHVEQALAAQTPFRAVPAAEVDPGRTIGLTSEGIDGVDIESPILVLTEEHRFRRTQFTPGFRRTLFDAVKTVNSTAFREWQPGEVLLDSVRAQRSQGWWQVTIGFKVRRNAEVTLKLTGADDVEVERTLTKKGWEYIWIQTATSKTGQGRDTITKIVARNAFLAQVYRETDFGALGLDTDPLR